MKLAELFNDAISRPNTNYFVIDSGKHTKDRDYIAYEWDRRRNNKIKEGDVFIYRKSQKLSANKQFYLYGVGQFSQIIGEGLVVGEVINGHEFQNPIFQSHLNDFTWEWKKRGNSWEHFWDQYGINNITKNDFVNLLSLLDSESYDPLIEDEVIKANIQIASGNYFMEDKLATTKVRAGQQAWSNKVKKNFGFACAMCDITDPQFLIGSHITQWNLDKENRLNPQNGLCLCVLHDKAFDKGFLSVAPDRTVMFSSRLDGDTALNQQLLQITRKKIRDPFNYLTDENLLDIHRQTIFK